MPGVTDYAGKRRLICRNIFLLSSPALTNSCSYPPYNMEKVENKGGFPVPERSSAIEPYLRVSRVDRSAVKPTVRKRRFEFPAELETWETVGALLALVLLSRLNLMGELAPFGLAYWAVASRGEYRRMVLYGIFMTAAVVQAGELIAGVGLLLSAGIFCLLRYRLDKPRLPLTVAIGTALLLGSLPQLWLNNFYPYDIFLLGLEATMAMLAGAVFFQVHAYPRLRLAGDRDVEGITSWAVFAGLLLLSLVQEGSVLVPLAAVISRIIVLWAAFTLGPGMAAAAGALLGFLLGIQGAGFAWLGMLTFSGFFAGLFRSYGRFASAGGFLLAAVALSLYVGGREAVAFEAGVSAAAIALFLLAPLLPMRTRMLASFLPHSAEAEAKKIRELTANRIKDYALVFRELSTAFQQTATVEKESPLPLAALVDAVVEKVCKYCPSRRRCWEKDLQRTYNALLCVLAELESKDNGKEAKSPEFFQKICKKKAEFLQTVSMFYKLEAYQHSCNKRLEGGRTLVTMQLAGLSQIMFNLSKEVREGVPDAQKCLRNQYFHLEIGVAQAAKANADVCGDYYSYLELRDGKQAYILSDGMGNGSQAQQESRSAVQLVEQLLLAGFRKDAVVRTVNTILQLRSQVESFATLDLLVVDAENGEAEFLKIGAAPSYLRQQNRVREIKSPSVPMGILDDVELKPVFVQLENDALIVMLTDGIHEVLPAQPDWLKDYLAGQVSTHPQVLADEIMHQARSLSGQVELRDDITVLVCRAKRLKHKIRDFVSN